MENTLGWLFHGFNNLFKAGSDKYSGSIGRMLNHKPAAMVVYAILLGLTLFVIGRVPSGYIPQQDKNYLIGFAQLPDGATLDRTEKVIRTMSDIVMQTPGVDHAVALPGLSINGFTVSSNAGVVFVTLKPSSERGADQAAGAIAQSLNMQFGVIKDAFVMVLPPPPVIGLGTSGGFKLQIEDRADLGDVALYNALQAATGKAYQTPELAGVFSGFQINVPQLFVDIDRTRALQLGVPVPAIFDTLQIYLGSLYVNDFNKFGRTYEVIAQADAPFRAHAEDITRLKVRNIAGEMVPLGSVLTVKKSYGPERAMRYNGYRTADINGNPGPGYSSGVAQGGDGEDPE